MIFNKSYFSSLESSWDKLRSTSLPVVVYGMGDGCMKVLAKFAEYGIECRSIFASDEFVRGHEFQGYRVKRYAEICEEYEDFVVVPAFGTSLPDVMQRFESIAQEHALIMPDTPVFGDEYFSKDGLLERFDGAKAVYDMLCDEQSKEVYKSVLEFKITGDIHCLRRVFTQPHEAYENILRLGSDEVYLDLGAYTGDTIAEFIEHTNGQYRKIIALEPNARNCKKCLQNTAHLSNVEVHNAAAWDKDEVMMFAKKAGRQATVTDKGVPVQCVALDSLLDGDVCTYVKYDVEGADERALKGSVDTIRKCSPKICTALYHRAYDLIDIPLMIHEINPDYRFYVRQYPYYPSWETNLFCI